VELMKAYLNTVDQVKELKNSLTQRVAIRGTHDAPETPQDIERASRPT
jgi:hypothetical protein